MVDVMMRAEQDLRSSRLGPDLRKASLRVA